jgi:hypothetical protein
VDTVVADIKFLAGAFSSADFFHVYRLLNGAAYILARTCNVASSGIILDYAPDCILDAICTDLK